ncbi:MAG TPA: hypothetical protein VJ852_10150 [Gemmatimonadaceae bacterium]|nr:hypothetical protein [Gemmatimonadaceae bacterium]
MKSIQAKRLSALNALLAASIISIACAEPRAQRDIAAADAETFQAIVRSQLGDSASTGFLRVDARPAGDKDLLAPAPPTSAGFDQDSSADTATEADPGMIASQRKDILHDLHVEEGGPFVYPECGGFRTRRFRDSNVVHPDPECPRTYRRYVTVGVPTRGAAPIIAKARRPEVPAPDTTGELWTVLVTESSVGPGGQQWRQFAWLFRRDTTSGRLGVVEKYLLSWAE